MAGNIVKWWKHKILGGYKQFSVQECTTDSEELMYHQVRAPSSCSAPPDLLLVSDRENNIPLKSPVVNIITTATAAATSAAAASSSQKHVLQQQQQQQQHTTATTKELFSKNAQNTKVINSSSKNSSKLINMQQTMLPTSQQQQQQQQQHNEANPQQQQHQSRHHSKEERIHLEEFTCDVSVEGGKSSQPLQFSFTFYDLDGHHGKITKDDIVGIVYTIYESIGKSVVVPHCGSKTINVRLTVSPEGKSKATANKLKKMQPASLENCKSNMASSNTITANMPATATTAATTTTTTAIQSGYSRRQHRYRPRKLIKSDDEDDDSTSEKDLQLTAMAAAATSAAAAAAATTTAAAAATTSSSVTKSKSHASKYNNRMKLEQQQQQQQLTTIAPANNSNCCQSSSSMIENNRNLENNMEISMVTSNCQHDNNLYENMTTATAAAAAAGMTNLKCCALMKDMKKCDNHHEEECRGCVATTIGGSGGVQHQHHQQQQQQQKTTTDMYLKQASSRVKMLRKARKQKYQDHCLETRQRSFSVGSESCWKNRHYTKNSAYQQQQQQQQQQHAQLLEQQQQQFHQQQQSQIGETDTIDGVQLRNPQRHSAQLAAAAAANRNSAECWKTALNRNDLISIIRESMEKNRLCFQMNGKPQASVSPIRHSLSHQRQRSNTVSKIPTLIANHNNSIINNCSSSSNNNPNVSNNNNNNSSNMNVNVNNNNNNCHHDTNMHDISNISNNSNTTTNYHQQQQQHQQHHHQHHNNSHSHHLQPHIPIYHQQMAINPAVLAAQNGIVHSKMNLCGYDSFLHATICGGGTSHSPPPVEPSPPAIISSGAMGVITQQQPIATVQPIMTAINAAAVTPHLQQHQQQQYHQYHQQIQQQNSPKIYASPTTTSQQIKTSKILRSGTFSQTHHHPQSYQQQQNSPHYHGYQRLSSSNAATGVAGAKLQVDHLEKWLHEREQCAASAPKSQKSRKDIKNYDNLLFAKLTEKLQDSSLNAEPSDISVLRKSDVRRKQRTHAKVQRRNVEPTAKLPDITKELSNSSVASDKSDYATLIPINGDPIECENLLSNQTSDDDITTEVPATAIVAAKSGSAAATVKPPTTIAVDVATADLLDLNDDVDQQQIVDVLQVNVETTTTAGRNSSNSNSSSNDSGSVGSAAVVESTTNANAGGAATNSSSSSSLIHRYVHEHIHHHYHHFEDKDE